MTVESSIVGLYLHVPYCRALCHYCDFAKTANWDEPLRAAYLERLTQHVDAWLERVDAPLASLFIGGGTPSLYAEEYAPLFECARDRLRTGAEVTIEANPDDVDSRRLAIWRALGFNRLSLGVQTFDDSGLHFLKRLHDASAAVAAIERTRAVFDDVNVDLIYGWPGQTPARLVSDIERAAGSGATHLSLYTLTYEPRTPIGRAAARGRLVPQADDALARLYATACAVLRRLGFDHEEVSNWALPGHACQHNALYWQDASYIGVGVGAHGYIAGMRYHYPADDRRFVRQDAPRAPVRLAADELEDCFDVVVERERDLDSWLLEYVGSALRSKYGVDLQRIAARTGRQLRPNLAVARGLAEASLQLSPNGRLVLAPSEWFRESAWCLELLASLPTGIAASPS